MSRLMASFRWWSLSLGVRPSLVPRLIAATRPSLARFRMRVRSSSARPDSSARMPHPEGVLRSSPGPIQHLDEGVALVDLFHDGDAVHEAAGRPVPFRQHEHALGRQRVDGLGDRAGCACLCRSPSHGRSFRSLRRAVPRSGDRDSDPSLRPWRSQFSAFCAPAFRDDFLSTEYLVFSQFLRKARKVGQARGVPR